MKKSYHVWLMSVLFAVSAMTAISCSQDEALKENDQQALLKKQVEFFRESMTSSVKMTSGKPEGDSAALIAASMANPSKALLLANGASEAELSVYKDDVSLFGAALEVYAKQTSNP